MQCSSELATHAVRDAPARANEQRALDALRAFETHRRTTRAAWKGAVVEAKRCYVETVDAYRGLAPDALADLGWRRGWSADPRFAASLNDLQSVDQVVALLLEQGGRHAGWGEPYRTPSIAWRKRLLARAYDCDVDSLPAEIGESIFVPQAHCRRAGERLVSPHFLARLAWIRRLERTLPLPGTPFTVLEMGGGFGALSRLFKLTHPPVRLVLLDTPKGLFHQQAFLQASFPDASHQFVHSPDEPVGDADFVYVPHAFVDALAQHDVFVAVLADSFAPLEAASSWLALAQRRTRAAHLHVLAPFLNRIGTDDLRTIRGTPDWSLQLDRAWTVRDWEVDPDHERCPFFQTMQPRRLHVIASRDAPAAEDVEALQARVETLRLEDWSSRPAFADDRVVTGAEYPPARSRGDLDLTPDLGIDGTLFALWSLVRQVGDRESLAMLIGYLDYLNGQRGDVFFEEISALVALHAALA